jgi:sugar transferase (PEP-CTERM/EpsH1 system associated)
VRVLYLCHRIPYPPNKGDKIRAFYHLQAIASRHEVDLFTLADDASDLVHRPALMGYCRRITVAQLNPRLAQLRALPFLLTQTPLTLPYFYSTQLNREIREAMANRSYDRIFVYCSAMAQYVGRASEIPVMTDLVDVDSDKWTQYAGFSSFPFSAVYRREGRALREYERKVCERSSCVLVTTEREAQLLRQISDAARVHVIPNGVDTDYFQPLAVSSPDATPPSVVFTGDMSYFPNAEAVSYFARAVLPLVRQRVPGVRFVIVGRNPSRIVRQLQTMEGVKVTGFVPDVRTHLANAQVSVAPFSIAAGIQNKILEAMASGLPVVTTTRVARSLSAGAAQAVDVGDTPEEFAAHVVRLLEDPEFARRKGMEGRRRVATDYSWERTRNSLLDALEDSASKGTPKVEAHSPVS